MLEEVVGTMSAGLYLASGKLKKALKRLASTATNVAFGGMGRLGGVAKFGGRRAANSRFVRKYDGFSRRVRNLSDGFNGAARRAGRGRIHRGYWGLKIHGVGSLISGLFD